MSLLKLLKIQILDNFDNQASYNIINQVKIHETQYIGLSGGSTPIGIYRILNSHLRKFEQVSFFQIDERFVDQDSPRSNRKMILETLFNKIKKPNFIYISSQDEVDDHNTAIKSYNAQINEIMKTKTLLLLGMGNDGHTASLFPNDAILNKSLQCSEKSIIGNWVESQKEIRITVNHQILSQSSNILLLKGHEKGKIFKNALIDQQPENFPVLFALNEKSTVFMDKQCFDAFIR